MNVYEDIPHLVEHISTSNIISDPLRFLGWQLLVAIAKLMDGAYGAINTILGVNIMNIAPIRNIVSQISPIAWVLLSLALIIAAIFLMTHPDKLKLSDFARSFLFSVVLIVAIPVVFTTMNQVKDAGISDVQSLIAEQENTPGKTLLRSVTYDVGNSRSSLKNISGSVNPYYLNINAKLSRSDPWNYKITSIEEDNGRKVVKGEILAAGTFGIGEEHVYAYTFDFVNTFIILLVSLVALLFVGMKVAQIIYDLCFYQALAPAIFATDLQGSGRSKKFLQTLISSYFVMIIVLLLFKIYLDLSVWVASQDFNFVARILLLAGAAKGLIDGPDLITRLLGVDAGVSNGMATMMGMSMAARGVTGAVRGAGRVAGGAFNVAKATPSAVTGAAGRVSGYLGSQASATRQQARQSGHDGHQSGEVTSMASLRQQQREQRQAEPSSFRRGQLATAQRSERAGYRGSRNAQVGQSVGHLFSRQSSGSGSPVSGSNPTGGSNPTSGNTSSGSQTANANTRQRSGRPTVANPAPSQRQTSGTAARPSVTTPTSQTGTSGQSASAPSRATPSPHPTQTPVSRRDRKS